MKTKLILGLLGIYLAATVNSPACIYCMKLAQQGLSPDDPNGRSYDSPPAQWVSITNANDTNMASAAVMSNTPSQLPLPQTNITAAITITNGALLGWDVLAGYPITLMPELENNTNAVWADAQINALIPASVRALDQHDISAEGFMIPAQMENGRVVEFLLSRNPPACCYGGIPQIHEWIKVRVKSPGVAWEQYNIVRARGVLRVGAERVDGALTSIYRMDTDKIEITDGR